MMDRLLDGSRSFANAYIDDVIIFSRTWEEHLKHLREVLTRIQEAGLTVKPKKCKFGMAQCSYLGHVVGGGEVKMEISKVKAIQEFPTPTTKKQVRSFLGIIGYYRNFIPQYATIASPITDLTRKTVPNMVKWSPACEIAFRKLKEALCSEPVLKIPDFKMTFILQTDALIEE